MENILLQFDNTTFLKSIENFDVINFETSKLNNSSEEDWIIDKFLNEKFVNLECNYLIIDSSKTNLSIALRFLGHIRLTKSLSIQLCPILFISNKTPSKLLKESPLGSLFIFSKTDYVDADDYTEEDLVEKVNNTISPRIPTLNLESDIIPKLNRIFIPMPIGDNHQIGNEWGCLQFSEFVGLNLLTQNTTIQKKSKNLYFKYYQLYTNKEFTFSHNYVVPAQNKKILLIDDQAQLGWATTMEQFFDGSVLSIITENDNNLFVQKAKDKVDNEIDSLDLIILDLRLTREDNEKNETTQLSGFSVLRHIKQLNDGIPVLIITSSNKSWNMKRLLDQGADGYYVKESPMFKFSSTFSLDNFQFFKGSAERAIENGRYYKWFWKYSKMLIQEIDNEINLENATPLYNSNNYLQCLNDIKLNLKYAYKTLKTKNEQISNDYLNFVFVTYFRAIEDFIKQAVYKPHGQTDWFIRTRGSTPKYLLKRSSDQVEIPIIKDDDESFRLKNLSTESLSEDNNQFKIKQLKSRYAGLVLVGWGVSSSVTLDFYNAKRHRDSLSHGLGNVDTITFTNCKQALILLGYAITGQKFNI